MEAYGQSFYLIHETAQVREKMMKEINQISEIFSVSKSDATIVLIDLLWNSYKASDLLGDNKEKLFAELRLVQIFDLNQNESNSSSADHETTAYDGNQKDLIADSRVFWRTCENKRAWRQSNLYYHQKRSSHDLHKKLDSF
ncbi:putative E3 ubiquitin-protein ligase ARI16 [Cardamine amara subsp. amara]|uniref:E3 ubiquitin-protein ligase ARI16 n=1 Tax=Cardamine amara subsp. amara TaxID=228776 RepID=A0ABD1C7M0_CARAN